MRVKKKSKKSKNSLERFSPRPSRLGTSHRLKDWHRASLRPSKRGWFFSSLLSHRMLFYTVVVVRIGLTAILFHWSGPLRTSDQSTLLTIFKSVVSYLKDPEFIFFSNFINRIPNPILSRVSRLGGGLPAMSSNRRFWWKMEGKREERETSRVNQEDDDLCWP